VAATSRSPWSQFAVRLGAVVAAVWLLGALGVIEGADAAMRRSYYELRGGRDTHQGVVLVAADDATIAAWGPPPWAWDRLAALHAAIARGQPRAIAVVDPLARLVPPTAPPPAVAGAIARSALIVPDGGAASLGLGVDRGGAVDRIALAAPTPTVVARTLAHAGLAAPDPLIIDFLGDRGLPTVPAHRIAAGDIPPTAFADKIVVIGLTAPDFAGAVPTPVGALAPAQVQAHALLAAADGVALRPVPGWVRAALTALVAVLVLLVVPRLYGAAAAATAVVAAVVILAADYTLFAGGLAAVGATAPLAALGIAAAAAHAHERSAARRGVSGLRRALRQRRLDWRDAADDEALFWRRVAELARVYVDCGSSLVGELEPGTTHLRLRPLDGVRPDQIAERRRDVRRHPYRRAHLAQNPVWHDGFMARELGLKTLLVPLISGGRPLGFWLLNFPADAAVGDAHLALIRTLASEIALSMARRGQRGAEPERGLVTRLVDGADLAGDLRAIQREVDRQIHQHDELVLLGESLPLGLLVSTLWGEVRYRNPALADACGDDVGPAPLRSLPETLEALTGLGREAIHKRLGALVHELDEVRFAGRAVPGRPRHDYVLSWLGREGSAAARGERGEPLLLLCAVPAAERSAASRSSRPLPAVPAAPAPRRFTSSESHTIPVRALSEVPLPIERSSRS